MVSTLERRLELGERAARHAALMVVRADAERRAWRREWEQIAAGNQAIREALRPKLELAPPITFESISVEEKERAA